MAAVRPASEAVEDRFGPVRSRGTEFKHDAPSIRAAIGRCPVQVSLFVEYHVGGGGSPVRAAVITCLLGTEIVEHGLVPASAAVRRHLKYRPVFPVATPVEGRSIEVAPTVRGEAG